MPRKQAMEILLTGDMVTAEDAARIGLINRAVPEESLREETAALARTIEFIGEQLRPGTGPRAGADGQ